MHLDRNYPRPQLVRKHWQTLDGIWQFAMSEDVPRNFPLQILVPFCPQSKASGLQIKAEPVIWYRRIFTLSDYDKNKRTLLHFGAVDYACTVWINGQEAGSHLGGFCPFTFDITAYLLDGENEIVVRATDETDACDAPRGKQVQNPKGIWYTPVSGIWQTVWLEQLPLQAICNLKITPTLSSVMLEVDCEETLLATIFEDETPIVSHSFKKQAEIAIPTPKLWSPEQPFLYRVILTSAHDTVESYFGLRTFAMQEVADTPRLLLNGKPYFQKGLLDQGYWPDGLYTAPSDEDLCSDIEKAKALGFNMLRKHIKVEPARWYYHCDRLGMLVWQDMPSGATYPGDFTAVALPNIGIHVQDTGEKAYKRFHRQSETGRKQFIKELKDMVQTLYNAPCICMWVPFNEGWGQFDSANTTSLLWALDPTRTVDSASGWHDQGAGDVKSVHKYIFKVKPPRKQDARAYCLTEYGGYSQVLPEHAWDAEKSFGYRMYPTKKALTDAYRLLHETQIIPLLQHGLCAVIYTQLTDVELEVNGLFTYDRAVCKIDADTVRQINEKLVLLDC